jgi:hypothetical protein
MIWINGADRIAYVGVIHVITVYAIFVAWNRRGIWHIAHG